MSRNSSRIINHLWLFSINLFLPIHLNSLISLVQKWSQITRTRLTWAHSAHRYAMCNSFTFTITHTPNFRRISFFAACRYNKNFSMRTFKDAFLLSEDSDGRTKTGWEKAANHERRVLQESRSGPTQDVDPETLIVSSW